MTENKKGKPFNFKMTRTERRLAFMDPGFKTYYEWMAEEAKKKARRKGLAEEVLKLRTNKEEQ